MEANYFTTLWWFLPYIDMNQPRVYMCPPSQIPSHFPAHPIPQDNPSAPALSALSHASNLDWQSISHMVIYMFQCFSLKSSHPCLLPQRPKVCSLHLCLFCSLTYRVIIRSYNRNPESVFPSVSPPLSAHSNAPSSWDSLLVHPWDSWRTDLAAPCTHGGNA